VIEIVDAGWATTVQDHGRPGYAAIGVPAAGACDSAGLELANRLVGNAPDVAAFETAGGLRVRAIDDLIAVGGDFAPVTVRSGLVWDVPVDADRRWTYVAVRGGIVVEPVLGSAAHDTLSGLGPPPVEAGRRYAIGDDPGRPILVDHGVRPPDRQAHVRIWPGPRHGWFGGDVITHLCRSPWKVSVASRVGVRLAGSPLERAGEGELQSEGLVTGAIQVPHDGQPVVMLVDHPTTGGYPVVAVVDPGDLHLVAQARDGAQILFRSGERGTGRPVA
jgi:biotin-dependent carboxylase-like uncharacterized protein